MNECTDNVIPWDADRPIKTCEACGHESDRWVCVEGHYMCTACLGRLFALGVKYLREHKEAPDD